MLRSGQTLFTYLHLAADKEQADALMASGSTAIAYETVTASDGSLPLLTPMSEVAGRMSVQVGANCLQKANGGFGVLLGGVPGVSPAKVVILGGGVSGTHAAEMAVGLRADVTVVDRSVKRLRELSSIFGSQLKTVYSTAHAIEELVRDADLVIGAVLIAGAAAPKLVTRAMVKTMKPGAVLVDIAIDQGGCFETSRPTTHAEPTYVLDGVIHYCVTNMPGRGAAHLDFRADECHLALRQGARRSRMAGARSPRIAGLARGLNVHAGQLTHEAVANALGIGFTGIPRRLTAVTIRGRRGGCYYTIDQLLSRRHAANTGDPPWRAIRASMCCSSRCASGPSPRRTVSIKCRMPAA